jgi:hypothetical protein
MVGSAVELGLEWQFFKGLGLILMALDMFQFGSSGGLLPGFSDLLEGVPV